MPTYKLTAINTVQLKEFQEWTDVYGMMLDNDGGHVGGNGNLFTAHYVTGLVQKGLIAPEERSRILQVYRNNFRFPGVLMRAPSKPDDRNAHDDVMGLLSADAQLNPDPAKRELTRTVYQHGRDNYCDGVDEADQEKLKINNLVFKALKWLFLGKVRWTWNNVTENKFHVSSWLQRRMEMMATMQMSLREFVNPIYYIYWLATNYVWLKFGKKEHKDSYILRYHSAMACKGYGKFTDKMCDAIFHKINKDFGDFGQLLGYYFNKMHHPIVKLLKDL